jgi:hypothetical protein
MGFGALRPTIQIIKPVGLQTNADKRALTRGRPPSARDGSGGNDQRGARAQVRAHGPAGSRRRVFLMPARELTPLQGLKVAVRAQ